MALALLASRSSPSSIQTRSLANTFLSSSIYRNYSASSNDDVHTINQNGVPLLKLSLTTSSIFTNPPSIKPATLSESFSKSALLTNLLDKTPKSFTLPRLLGNDLQEHSHRVGVQQAEPWLSLAEMYASSSPPPLPPHFPSCSGWSAFNPADQTWSSISHPPDEPVLTFDTEVLYKIHPFAVLAVAASPTTWYAWLSPWLLQESSDPNHLVPFGPTDQPRLLIGHNIAYDRARIKEEYSLRATNNRFLDTMSLYGASHGIANSQRRAFDFKSRNAMLYGKRSRLKLAIGKIKAELEMDGIDEQDALSRLKALQDELDDLPAAIDKSAHKHFGLWDSPASSAWDDGGFTSLANVADHFELAVDKTRRSAFTSLDPDVIRRELSSFLKYCAEDVAVTHRVFQRVFPQFQRLCPSPVSFAGQLQIASSFLPIDKAWESSVGRAEVAYEEAEKQVAIKFAEVVEKTRKRWVEPPVDWVAGELDEQAVRKLACPEQMGGDPWLSQLDWTPVQAKRVSLPKSDPSPARHLLPSPSAQKATWWPAWYHDLYPCFPSKRITLQTSLAPILLRLEWESQPIHLSKEHGLLIRCPRPKISSTSPSLPNSDILPVIPLTRGGTTFRPIPHPHLRDHKRVQKVFTKAHYKWWKDGKLSTADPLAAEVVEAYLRGRWWEKMGDKFKDSMAVWQRDGMEMGFEGLGGGMIVPMVVPMGAISRRPVDRLWLHPDEYDARQIGSELKTLVRAPPGYSFVGAKIDPAERWIPALIADSLLEGHGSSPLGASTHGVPPASPLPPTTGSVDLTEDERKTLEAARIRGAGSMHAAQLLWDNQPMRWDLPMALEIDNASKGSRFKWKAKGKGNAFRPFWFGGTESGLFNAMEDILRSKYPRTPFLRSAISSALRVENLQATEEHLTARTNWLIQSSETDYLHLLIANMNHLCSQHAIHARFLLAPHDSIRYLVKSEDSGRAALALQIANLWSRAYCSAQLGLNGLPHGIAFFPEVQIDSVLRQDVNATGVTPSNPDIVLPGKGLTLDEIVKRTQGSLDPLHPSTSTSPIHLSNPPSSIALSSRPYIPSSSTNATEPTEWNDFRTRAQACRTTGQVEGLWTLCGEPVDPQAGEHYDMPPSFHKPFAPFIPRPSVPPPFKKPAVPYSGASGSAHRSIAPSFVPPVSTIPPFEQPAVPYEARVYTEVDPAIDTPDDPPSLWQTSPSYADERVVGAWETLPGDSSFDRPPPPPLVRPRVPYVARVFTELDLAFDAPGAPNDRTSPPPDWETPASYIDEEPAVSWEALPLDSSFERPPPPPLVKPTVPYVAKVFTELDPETFEVVK